ncbi:hypothetical protein ACN22W_08225 [Burkholderia theae]|uniref:hypothetical protein n=1 Tax=Burkholderia theae TaxID=3143496 RepID=UPI003AFB2172
MTTANTPNSLPSPIDVLREMARFEAAMRLAFDYTPDRNPFTEVVPHAEEAYQLGRDNDRFMGWCMAIPSTVDLFHEWSMQSAFQSRVRPWMLECFGAEIAADRAERNHRFFEEAGELVQACDMTREEAHALVDYTWLRPVGEPAQEVGGVMVTLAALCLSNGLDMHAAGETELARITVPETIAKIRAKQAAKPKHSPLPEPRAKVTDDVRLDAERMRAICAELDANRRGVSYSGMPIWDAMCDAVGEDRSGDGMRAAIDTARAGDAS